MAISGGVKFFGENACLIDGAASIAVSSGSAVKDYAIDKNAASFWTSVGSNDITQESLVVTFGSTSISRILLVDHNFKGFTVKYWDGAAYQHFAGVVGLDGTKTNITETAFADTTAYYEVTPVTTTRLQILVTTAQTVNAQKYIATIFASTELGTLVGFPKIDAVQVNRNPRTMTMLSGKVNIVKSNQVFACTLNFSPYSVGSAYVADLDLMMTLFDRATPFHIWLSGGRRGTGYYSYTLRGWRLKDLFRVQMDPQVALSYTDSIYRNPVNFNVQFLEHV